MFLHHFNLELEEGSVKAALPNVSVIIPTYNHAAEIGFTLESLLSQEVLPLEILIIDARSTDRTVEIVKSFHSDRIKVFSVSSYNQVEMWNRGILASHGDFLNFLEPGSSYLFPSVIKEMMQLAVKEEFPLVVYGAALKRIRKEEPKFFIHPLTQEFLAKGIMPTSMEACFFSVLAFKKAGTFSADYKWRGAFEFLVRLSKKRGNVFSYTTRVILDTPIRLQREKKRVVGFKERWRAIRHHYGFRAALWYLAAQTSR